MMVTFTICGRRGQLGNQLFQLAAGIALAKENNDIFAHNWHCSYSGQDMSKYFKNKLPTYTGNPKIDFTYNDPIWCDYNKIPYQKNIDLNGFFQSEKYFENNKDLIKHYFEPEEFLINNILSKYGQILAGNTCAIHVRRYNESTPHQLCQSHYFNSAIDFVNSKQKVDNYLVISDDIAWCKKNLPSNVLFVEGNLFIEDLFIMGLCKHNIISNSSFSWWGSWFNCNPNKITIAPSKWFSGKPEDIYRPDMIRISNDI